VTAVSLRYDYDDYEATVPEKCVLNVTGSRESKFPVIHETVWSIMMDVLADTKSYNKLVAPLFLWKTSVFP